MKERILSEELIADFFFYLKSEEKSENTVEKYLRDVRGFAAYLGGADVTKETVVAYKGKLIAERYAVRSVNSMLASLNSLFAFLGWSDCRVKSVKLQRQIYCPEEKETDQGRISAACKYCQAKRQRAAESDSADNMRNGNQGFGAAIYHA